MCERRRSSSKSRLGVTLAENHLGLEDQVD
jgi:hypothetical protein